MFAWHLHILIINLIVKLRLNFTINRRHLLGQYLKKQEINLLFPFLLKKSEVNTFHILLISRHSLFSFAGILDKETPFSLMCPPSNHKMLQVCREVTLPWRDWGLQCGGRGEMRAQTSVGIEKATLKLTQQQTEADTSLGSFTPIHAVTETTISILTSHK